MPLFPKLAHSRRREGFAMNEEGLSRLIRRDLPQGMCLDRRHEERREVGVRPLTILAGEQEDQFFLRNISRRGAMGQTALAVTKGQMIRLGFEDGSSAPA